MGRVLVLNVLMDVKGALNKNATNALRGSIMIKDAIQYAIQNAQTARRVNAYPVSPTLM